MKRFVRCTIILVALAALSIASAGQQRQAARDPKAPNDFDMATADGVGVRYSAVAPSGNWLLVVVHTSNHATDKLLSSLDRNRVPQMNGRVVVVGVGMTPAKLKEMKAAHPEMVDATWFIDTGHGIADQLGIRVVPAASGMRDMGAEWRVTGGLLTPDRLRSMTADWMRKEAAMDESRARREGKVKPVKE